MPTNTGMMKSKFRHMPECVAGYMLMRINI